MTDPFAKLHPVVADLIRRGMASARSGRTAYARREFEQALALDPDCHEALLWLAALAPDGRTSLRYLSRALELNPLDPRAHAGIRWARKRIQPPAGDDEITQPVRRVDLDGDTQPSPSLVSRLARQTWPSSRPDRGSADIDDRPRRVSSRWQWALAAIISACVVLAGGMALVDAIGTGHASAEAEPPLALAQITSTANATEVPAATATSTPIPSDTPAPSDTPVPTETPPIPTETPVPTETPSPLPTDTPIPPPTATPYVPPPPTTGLPPAGGDPSSRWIDVNLTTQTVTAYEGDAPVRHFIVSTGLWNTPTVTGQFRVYLRYDSQTMSGPGYYLPNVKWVQYFYQGYALHGTYWHNNFGQPMSHGCVNFTEVEAEWLYQWADYGTLVNVHY
jgi:lipoprotein-anchoring transpeptidase ErfK/SrfK